MTIIRTKARAFTNQPIQEHNFDVDDRGVVRVWDPVANHFTICFGLSLRARDRIRKMARLRDQAVDIEDWQAVDEIDRGII